MPHDHYLPEVLHHLFIRGAGEENEDERRRRRRRRIGKEDHKRKGKRVYRKRWTREIRQSGRGNESKRPRSSRTMMRRGARSRGRGWEMRNRRKRRREQREEFKISTNLQFSMNTIIMP